MVRKLAVGFGIVFMIVIGLGWMPQCITEMHMTPSGPERTMFGLFKMSMLDDVTHGLSALLLLAASLKSRPASLLALTAFGWYYAYDATIYLVTGVLQSKPLGQNIGLNIPHVIISGIMLWLAYRGRANAPSAAATAPA